MCVGKCLCYSETLVFSPKVTWDTISLFSVAHLFLLSSSHIKSFLLHILVLCAHICVTSQSAFNGTEIVHMCSHLDLNLSMSAPKLAQVGVGQPFRQSSHSHVIFYVITVNIVSLVVYFSDCFIGNLGEERIE